MMMTMLLYNYHPQLNRKVDASHIETVHLCLISRLVLSCLSSRHNIHHFKLPNNKFVYFETILLTNRIEFLLNENLIQISCNQPHAHIVPRHTQIISAPQPRVCLYCAHTSFNCRRATNTVCHTLHFSLISK